MRVHDYENNNCNIVEIYQAMTEGKKIFQTTNTNTYKNTKIIIAISSDGGIQTVHKWRGLCSTYTPYHEYPTQN